MCNKARIFGKKKIEEEASISELTVLKGFFLNVQQHSFSNKYKYLFSYFQIGSRVPCK